MYAQTVKILNRRGVMRRLICYATYATSDLGLHHLPMFHRKYDMHANVVSVVSEILRSVPWQCAVEDARTGNKSTLSR